MSRTRAGHGLIVMALLLWLTGCAVSSKDTVLISQPVSQTTEDVTDNTGVGAAKKMAIPQSIAILPFHDMTGELGAEALIRQVINSHLAGKNFRLMHPGEVDSKMPNGPVDPSKIASYLGVDGVLEGNVITFERFYAGIYAQIRLGVELKLYNTKGEVVWEGTHEVVQSAGGISTTPWGLLLNAAVAAMHLSDDNLLAAADELGREVASDFPQPASYALTSGPVIESVLHDKGTAWLHYGDVMQVGLKGEPGLRASITLGNLIKQPLKEIEPGVYMGDIVIAPDWNATRVPVTGVLQDGQGSTRTLLSIAGLVNIDNTPPAPVGELSGSLTDKVLKLAWNASDDATLFDIYARSGDVMRKLATSTDPFINLELSHSLFERYDFVVVAEDRAGNVSENNALTLTAYPKEVGKQIYLTGPLQGRYEGIVSLTKTFSPYQINGSVMFDEMSELYVEPGVELQFSPQASITVSGQAYFWGDGDKISFVPLGDYARKQPYLTLNSTRPVQLSGIEMKQPGVGIDIKAGNPLIDVIEIVGSRFTALNISGEASVLVRHCLIDGSNTSAIVVSDYAKLDITGCVLRNNFPFHIQNASSYEVKALDNQWEPAVSPTNMLGKIKVQP